MMKKGRIRKRFFVAFIVILVSNLFIISFQYIRLQKFNDELQIKRSTEDFFLIKESIKTFFEHLDQIYNNESSEVLSKTNLVYNLLWQNSSFVGDNFQSAKILITSNLTRGNYEIMSFDQDLTIKQSTCKTKECMNPLVRQWLKRKLQQAKENDMKIFVSSILVDAEQKKVYLVSVVLMPDGKNFLSVVYSDDIGNMVTNKLAQIQKRYERLVGLKLYLLDRIYNRVIDIKQNSVLSTQTFEYTLANRWFDGVQPPSLKGIINELDQNSYICIPQKHSNRYFTLMDLNGVKRTNYIFFVELEIKNIKDEEITFIKQMILFFVVFSIVITLYLFYIIFTSITRPLEKITNYIYNNQEIDDSEILHANNEISFLAKVINRFNRRLKYQVEIKNKLLENQKKFIANAVHEIATPLNVITLNTTMLELECGEDKEEIRFIVSAVKQLATIKEAIVFSMLKKDIKYPVEMIDLKSFLQERVKYFSQIAWVNSKEIVCHCENNHLSTAISQTELMLLVDNNISNAIKYGIKQDKIEIVLQTVQNAQKIQLEFISYGKPIEDLSKIFQRFYREDQERKGFGIGLNIVKEICKKYNIEVIVESDADGKNRFIYIFDKEEQG